MNYQKGERAPKFESQFQVAERARKEREKLEGLPIFRKVTFQHGANKEFKNVGVIQGIEIDTRTKYGYDAGSLDAMSRDRSLSLADIPSHSITIRITEGKNMGQVVKDVKAEDCKLFARKVRERK